MTHLPSLTFIGAGRVAQTLATACLAQGLPIAGIASRREATAQSLAHRLNVPALTMAQAATAGDLVFLTVPDDAIAPVAASLPWRAGLAVVHCSGATEVDVLAPAQLAGAAIGGFHPLQLFADPVRAVSLLPGTTVAIEAESPLLDTLRRLAQQLGMHPITLPPGSRARYHAAAGYAASFLLPLLQEAATLWASFGVTEADALRALLPLARGTLDTVAGRGIAASLSGPISRGDTTVIEHHLTALATLGPKHVALYRELAARQLSMAAQSGRLDANALARLTRLLA